MEVRSMLKKFLKYFKGNVWLLVVSLLSALIYVGCMIAIPYLVGKSIDMFTLYSETSDEVYMNYVFYIILIMTFLIVFGFVFDFIFENSLGRLSYKIAYKVRKEVYDKYNSVSIKTLDNMKMGDLLQRNILDVELLLNGLISSISKFFVGVITICATIVFMFIINYLMALVVVVLTPLSFFVSRFVSKKCNKYFKQQSKDSSVVNSDSLEVFSNLKLVQSFNYQDKAYETFEKHNATLYESGQKAMFSSSWVNPSTRLVNNIIYCIVGIVGIILFIYQPNIGFVVTIGAIASFLSYTMQYTKPFNEISSVVSEIGLAKSSFKRITSFLYEKDDIDEGTIEDIKEIETIEFKNVCFSYVPNKKLIENFSVKVKKGMKVAIVGPTGCGKTTMINLLMRFYDPTSGEILINGIDSRKLTKETLREHFKMVLQDSWIFNGTIFENVRYSVIDAIKEDVVDACKKANCDGFINTLPKGYDTMVGKSFLLSEGEKQLICISRCMLSLSDVVILDEATSSVDSRTEMKISKAFDELIKGKTAFVIAHRLSTIINSDLILVMKDGNIIEQGTHKELLKNGSFYPVLYMSQFEH